MFDFGGTLDANGDHWSEVLWDAYQDLGLPVEKEDFRKAYVQGERELSARTVITPGYHFSDVLRAKLNIQLKFLSGIGSLPVPLVERERMVSELVEHIGRRTSVRWATSVGVLGELKKRYPLVLVSNFYGNIHTVLEEAAMLPLFDFVIESAVVGLYKPDPDIFALGLRALGLAASEVVVVGDSFSKDIEPAHRLGCRTVWLKGRQWEEREWDEALPDVVIRDLEEIRMWL